MDTSIAGLYVITSAAQHTETLVRKASQTLRGGAAVRASLAVLAGTRRSIALAPVAIGGITLQNASQAFGAGVDAAAVTGALFEAGGIGVCVSGFTQLC